MIIKNKNKSFTLIELLVVIVIIGILAGVIMISTSSSIDKANFAKAQAFSSTVQNELLSNLVSEWTFDNPSSIGEDTWGNNDGIPVNITLETNDCVYGSCLKIDSKSDYFELNNDINDITISVLMWYYYDGSSGNWSTLLCRNDGTYHHLLISTTDEIGYFNSGWYSSTKKLIPKKWHNLALIKSGTNSKLYINGILAQDQNTSFSNSLYPLKVVGNYGGHSQGSLGFIDDVRVYNAALSSSQIKQNYIAGLNSMLANGNISKQEYNERINVLAYDN